MTRQLIPRATPAFTNVFREMDDMQHRLRRFLTIPTSENFPTEPMGWVPAVEIMEKPDALVLTAELPGLTRQQIDVSFEDDILTIKGEKIEEKREEKDEPRFHLFERFYGTFARSFVVPRTIDPMKIQAEFTDGVLVVRMPKAAQAMAKGRKIEIKAAP